MRSSLPTLLVLTLLLIVAVLLPTPDSAAQTDQAQPADACSAVADQIAGRRLPFDTAPGGGLLQPDTPADATLAAGAPLDAWAMAVRLPRDAEATALPDAIRVRLESSDFPAEIALYDGLEPVPDSDDNAAFRAITPGAERQFPVAEDGTYTLLLRPIGPQAGDYRLAASFPGGGEPVIADLRDATLGTQVAAPSQRVGGLMHTTIGATTFVTPLDALSAIATRDGEEAQIFFGGQSSLLLGPWASRAWVIGGDLAVRGSDPDGVPRLLSVRGYDHRVSLLDPLAASYDDGAGTAWAVDWTLARGLWLDATCAGALLHDTERVVLAQVNPSARQAAIAGSQEALVLGFSQADNALPRVDATLDMGLVASGATITIKAGTLTLPLVESRMLTVQAAQPRISARAAASAPALDLALQDRELTLALDWQAITALTLTPDALRVNYSDARGLIERDAADLQFIEALDGVLRLRARPTLDADGIEQPGAESLLLTPAEGLIEILTPGGAISVDATALPDAPGYLPRGLNNTGGECYGIGTFLTEANCPPNGHINPANGNLWLAMTDLIADGGEIDLALSRSYNSRLVAVDGPFGPGWTTALRLDYAVAFDAAAGSRPVTPADAARSPVGLDVTLAPRGLVTWFTASGSRHLFLAEDDVMNALRFAAPTLPGWTLTRESARAPWTLQASHGGYTLTFDRAGRLLSYGYPALDRLVRVQRPADPTAPVIVSDAPGLRHIALRLDAAGRITSATLRDLSVNGANPDDCAAPDSACQQVRYSYDDAGRLVRVQHADGSEAQYQYDEAGRLIDLSDPYAPIAPHMSIRYDETGGIRTEIAGPDDAESTAWQALSAPEIDDEAGRISRTLTDTYGGATRFSYTLVPGDDPFAALDAYTLAETAGPLAQASDFDALPTVHRWQDGRYIGQAQRATSSGVGRSSIGFSYDEDGTFSVDIGYPQFDLTLDLQEAGWLTTAAFADGSVQRVQHDDAGRVIAMTDERGAEYRLNYSDDLRRIEVLRANDGRLLSLERNAAGLVVAHTVGLQDQDGGTTVRITYDGFGRPVRVEDPLTGTTTMRYAQQPGRRIITTEDAAGTQTIQQTDLHGRLLTETVVQGERLLQATRISRDARGRIVAEARQLAPLDDAAADTWLTTRVRYDSVATLPALPDSPDGPVPVDGYAITRTDAAGRTTREVFDALGRLRAVSTPDGLTLRYDYTPTADAENTPFGIDVIETQVLSGRVIDVVRYTFDGQWQLRAINRGQQAWFFGRETGFIARPTLIDTRLDGRSQLSTGWSYTNGRDPDGLRLLYRDLDGAFNESVTQTVQRDFLGRALVRVDGTGVRQPVAYCPLADGGERIVIGLPGTESTTCDAERFAELHEYDAAGRLVRAATPDGERLISITPAPQAGGWQVEVRFSTGDRWQILRDGLGQPITWTDESGVTRGYQHDTLGRLLTVEVADQPEASFRYVYNEADQVTLAVDGLGRGTRTDYDARGRVTLRQDARSGDATVFGYNADGQLALVVSPLGSSTAYRYTDPADPLRLTGIAAPTGAALTFDWVQGRDSGELVATDGRGSQTVYRFDWLGRLWAISDALGRSHALVYNAAGQLTEWRFNARPDGSTALRYTLERPSPDALIVSAGSGLWTTSLTLRPDGLAQSIDSLTLTRDALGRLVSVALPDAAWALNHAPGEATLTVIEPDGREHRLSYDALDRLTLAATPGADRRYDYARGDGGSVVLTLIDTGTRLVTFSTGDNVTQPRQVRVRSAGNAVTYTYDGEGRIVEITHATCIALDRVTTTDPVTSDACFSAGQPVWTRTERVAYDSAGRPVRRIDAEQNVETLAYDDAGNIIVYQDRSARSTFDYTYDALNRLTSVTGPTGLRLILGYDSRDRIRGVCRTRAEAVADFDTCAADPANVLMRFQSDALGRLAVVEQPGADGPHATTFNYAAHGGIDGWTHDSGGSYSVLWSEDGLTLPTAVTLDDDSAALRYNLAFDTGLTLTRLDDVLYTLNERGQVASLTLPNEDVTINARYDSPSVTFGHDASEMRFGLDSRRLLTTIGAAAQADYFVSPDGRVMIVSVTREDGEEVELRLDRRGGTANITYIQTGLLINHTTDAADLLGGQSYVGTAAQLSTGTGDALVGISYDSAGRPLTMLLTDRREGNLVYRLSLGYDGLGRLATETRLYPDETQVTFSYSYGPGDQLISRSITVNRPADDGGGDQVALALASLMLLGVMADRGARRRIALAALTGGTLAGLALSISVAQNTGAATLSYGYDARGNLTTIQAGEATCARYSYDAADRLVSATNAQGTTISYAYDPLDRLTHIDDIRLIYLGDSQHLLATAQDGTLTWYGGSAGMPAFYQMTEGQSPRWLVHDGRGTVVAASQDGQTSSPLWLFDPLGRYLSLVPPTDAVGCPTIDLPTDLLALGPLPNLGDGRLWHGASGLSFSPDGRAYLAEIGRYLQRDPHGPDALGTIYGQPSRAISPPVRVRQPAYFEPLLSLREALTLAEVAQGDSAADVRARHTPDLQVDAVVPLLATLSDHDAAFASLLDGLHTLPDWLMSGYSLRGMSLAADGTLHLADDIAPGFDAQAPTTVLRPSGGSDGWVSGAARWTQLTHGDNLPVPLTGIQAYQPFGWQSSPVYGGYDRLEQSRYRSLPGDIWERLPQRLSRPMDAAFVIDAVLALSTMPAQRGVDWLLAALHTATPQAPTLPPEDMQTYLRAWLSDDTLGLAQQLGVLAPALPPIPMPTYTLGPNP